jgi:steroid delta-isomerase-like uncharacterized protein
MDKSELERLARASVEDVNRGDWAAVRTIVAPSYVYEETGTGARCEGPDELVSMLEGLRQAVPDLTGEVLRVLADGDLAVLEIKWRGTQTGELDLGGPKLPPSGRQFDFWGCIWQRWENGKLVNERHHLDALTMLTQLGAIPEPSSA